MVTRVFAFLLLAYFVYSLSVYYGTSGEKPSTEVQKGFAQWQSKNCQSCHQLYGLGGYMGPDLTNLMSAKEKGAAYASVFIKNGSARMPAFHLSDKEVGQLIAFLQWVDRSGRSAVPADRVTSFGNYQLDK